MSVDLALASQSPPAAVASRIGKGANSRLETQQAINVDGGEFGNVLSAMDGDSSFQPQRPSMRTSGSDLQQLREGKPESASEPPVPSDTNGGPNGVSNLAVNASLANLTWPTLFVRTPVQEAAVSEADGASGPGQVARDDVGNSRTNMAQRPFPDPTPAPDDERLSASPTLLSPDAQPEQQPGRPAIEAQRSETIPHVAIKSLETHFPVVLSMLFGGVPAPSDDGRRNAIIDTARGAEIAETHLQIGAPIKISNPEFENTLQRQSPSQTFMPEEERFSISVAPDARPKTEAKADQERSENTLGVPPSETIQHAPINSLETRFAAVLSNMLVGRAPYPDDNEQRNVNISIAPTSQIAETRQQIGAPTKILTLELEPASLGTVTVRMKMSRSNVDMQIRVDSMDALHALNAARDKLVEAIQSSGCAVGSCTIQVAPTPASADSSQYMAGDGARNMGSSGSELTSSANIGQGGAEHGAQNDGPREDRQDPRARRPGEAASSRIAGHIHGLYL